MKITKTLLYGASGHAKVISSIFESMNILIHGVFDDDSNKYELKHLKVIHGYDKNYEANLPILISIGDNLIRKQISKKIVHSFTNAIHPSSIIDKSVFIDKGTAIFHNATIQSDTQIGKHCIINTNSSVDHDCSIGDFVHISPSATLCGNVVVGEGSHIGAGATIVPNIKIGNWCTIGAGSVITKDIPSFSVVVGIPGRVIKILSNE